MSLLVSACGSPPRSEIDTSEFVSRTEFDKVSKQVREIDAKVWENGSDQTLIVAPSEKGFALVRSNLGTLSFTFKSVEPFADGSRLILTIGNPLAVDITKLDIHLKWGPADAKGMMIYDPPPREMDYTVKEVLRAGSWTDVKIDLGGIPPNRFGMLIASKLTVESMKLNK